MADEPVLRTNQARLVERFVRSIEGAGYGGMANYETARLASSDLAEAVELAYGILWLFGDNENPNEYRPKNWDLLCANGARQVLLQRLDKAGQARGIEKARTLLTGGAS